MIYLDDQRNTTLLTEDEKDGLLPPFITTQSELNAAERVNIADAYTWLENPRYRKNILSIDFIQNLHKKMFGDVWTWAGQFRKAEKNIGIREYWKIPIELKNLCEDTKVWIDQSTYESDEIAVRFHHRLVWVHPFPNGNGRLSRLMADLILETIFHNEPLTWGRQTYTDPSKLRSTYIEAIQAADQAGQWDFSLLLEFVRS